MKDDITPAEIFLVLAVVCLLATPFTSPLFIIPSVIMLISSSSLYFQEEKLKQRQRFADFRELKKSIDKLEVFSKAISPEITYLKDSQVEIKKIADEAKKQLTLANQNNGIKTFTRTGK